MFLHNKTSAPTISQTDLNYISSASAALLEQTPRGARHLLWLIAAFVTCFIVWACLAKVDEFSRGEGRVIPSQQVQIIQNLEGGILAEFYVREGDQVQRGEKLLRIDDTRFASSLREAELTQQQLELKSLRLRAEADAEPFVVAEPTRWPDALLERERELFELRAEELVSTKQVLEEQIEQKEQEISELQARRDQLRGSLDLLEMELTRTREAAAGGAISEVELLRMERQLNDLRGEYRAAELALPRAESSLEEAQRKLANVGLAFRREAREELNDVTSELGRLGQSATALADRVERTTVTSPVGGTVKRFLVNTVGGVIQPGMDIAEIVPSEELLLVEARVRPADIAYLHPGQEANIRFTAYDFSVMGGLSGRLVHISPDTIEDENGDSYYLVRVETSDVFSGPDGSELPIIPGMTVSVDILTGRKTVMSYLLKPILKTQQLALRER